MLFFSRFKISAKLFSIILVFGFPLLVLFFHVLSVFAEKIEFSTLEVYGDEFLRPCSRLLELAGTHRLAFVREKPREKLSDQIESAIRDLEDSGRRVGSALQFTDEGLKKRNREHLSSDRFRALWKSISSIAQNAGEASRISVKGTTQAGNASGTMNLLGKAAQEIGKVTHVIKRIAEQTNLLALNATIEAASAGDAGKGFAVVANEVKELANQSARAAEDIATKIEGIQTNKKEAIQVMSEVGGMITKITEMVTVITADVDRQNKSANEISLSVTETTKGAGDIAMSIAELAKGSNDISRSCSDLAKASNDVAANILGVSRSAEGANASAKQVNSLAERLAEVAGILRSEVGKFVAK